MLLPSLIVCLLVTMYMTILGAYALFMSIKSFIENIFSYKNLPFWKRLSYSCSDFDLWNFFTALFVAAMGAVLLIGEITIGIGEIPWEFY